MHLNNRKHLNELKSAEIRLCLIVGLQLISCYLQACFLPHEIHEHPDALIGINIVYSCNKIGKRSCKHFNAISFYKIFWREHHAWSIASAHQTRDKLNWKRFWSAIRTNKPRYAKRAVDCAPVVKLIFCADKHVTWKKRFEITQKARSFSVGCFLHGQKRFKALPIQVPFCHMMAVGFKLYQIPKIHFF